MSEPYSLEEKIQSNDPLGQKVSAWHQAHIRENAYFKPEKLKYLTDEVVSQVDSLNLSSDNKLLSLNIFRPLVAGLTMDDFLKYVVKASETRNVGSGWGRSYVYFRASTNWREEILLQRSVDVDPTGRKFDRNAYDLRSVISEDFSEGKKTSVYGKEVNQLNEYLVSDFEGTFGEFLDSPKDQKITKAIEEYRFNTQYAHFTPLISFASVKSVASFTKNTQKRTRELLLAQNKEAWKVIIEEAPKWRKGKTHQHTEKFLEEVNAKVKGETLVEHSSEENAKKLILMLVAGISKIENLPANKFNALVKQGVNAVPTEYNGEIFKKEYAELIAHLETDELKPREIVAMIFATIYPKLWIRGNGQNAFYLLLDLLNTEHKRLYISMITEVIYEDLGDCPTEKEWRNSVDVATDDLPTDWFFQLIVNKKGTRTKTTAVPAEVALLRQLFV